MPNWVNNVLHIHKSMLSKIVDKDGNVDFRILKPVPEEFTYTSSPAPYEDIALYEFSIGETESLEKLAEENKIPVFIMADKIIRQYEETKEAQKKYLILGSETADKYEKYPTPESYGKLHVDLLEKYGCSDWYAFHLQNWGCKWNASDSNVMEECDDFMEIIFDTPWSPPFSWTDALAHEGMPFYLSWYEEQGYQGSVVFDGKIVKAFELPDVVSFDVAFDSEENEYDSFISIEETENLGYKIPDGVQTYDLDENNVMHESENGKFILSEDMEYEDYLSEMKKNTEKFLKGESA